jgi:hypothetical protein
MSRLHTRWVNLNLLSRTDLLVNTDHLSNLLQLFIALSSALEFQLLLFSGTEVVDSNLLAKLGIDIFLLNG